ncbi:MAG: DUF3990 domain-containing protein [Clostridiales Family XIII bacterium]|jgi:hypothetical protein|nr:DUF3990 domain-containing protein [Clostridiales Family XIII bacterium]
MSIMDALKDGKPLYHTSYTLIERIDLGRCKKTNDFGRGFYLTTSKDQALRFVNAALRKSGGDLQSGYILSYAFERTDDLNICEFRSTDAEWLHCICGHRRRIGRIAALWDSYDVLAGKVANDDTNATITFYLNGAYGEIGSEDAVAATLRQLHPEALENQICLKTQSALDCLKLVGYEEAPKYERDLQG